MEGIKATVFISKKALSKKYRAMPEKAYLAMIKKRMAKHCWCWAICAKHDVTLKIVP